MTTSVRLPTADGRRPTSPLGQEETARLVRAWRASGGTDHAARGRGILGHRGLVYAAAWRFVRRSERAARRGAEDLAQPGFLGLVRAFDGYDPDRPDGVRFSTYASRAIYNEIRKDLLRDRAIVPPFRGPDRAPRAREFSAFDRADAEGPGWFGAHVPDRDATGPAGRDLPDPGRVRAALATLPERHARTLALRYGLADGVPRSHAEVGAALGFSFARSWAIERLSLRRLRAALGGGDP
jgi:RNA polymerase sigma factor (sigma-70 family)